MAPLPWPTLAPLFWQHGEPHEVLVDEMRGMHAAGIRAFILESRPHPDFAGPRWWSDLDAIVAEARRLGMQVWIFDDKVYPTGFANGTIRTKHPEAAKRFLRRERIEAIGPLPGASFRVGAWCGPGETMLAVVTGRLADEAGTLDPSSLLDATPSVRDGVLYWDVPPGRWRVYVIVVTPSGGEEWTKDYLNPLDPAATRVLLDEVYEPHYARYRDEFGVTIAGFFSDEPRFGNAGTYDARIGRYPMVLPWCDGMLERLSAAWGGSFVPALPCLWDEAGHAAARARVAYMDLVSRLYADSFSRPIGDWCRAHGVRYIGHAVEDNGAHTRLGYGAGHFFRALAGQDASGFDLVYQVWPGHVEGRYLTPFGDLDARFFTWGIAKLASSAAHMDPLKNGATACEIFGAYGWRLGLRMMKWLTDHACVRGATLLDSPRVLAEGVPRPRLPAPFPGPGHEPAMAPLRRVVGVRRPGVPRALGRHARGERRRAVPRGGGVVGRGVRAVRDGGARPRPGADRLRRDERRHAARRGCDGFRGPPSHDRDGALRPDRGAVRRDAPVGGAPPPARSRSIGRSRSLLPGLAPGVTRPGGRTRPVAGRPAPAPSRARAPRRGHSPRPSGRWGLHDVEASPSQPHLRVYHYRTAGRDTWFLVNESLREPVDTTLTLRGCTARVTGHDALDDRTVVLPQRATRAGTAVEVRLEPFESLFLLEDTAGATAPAVRGPLGLAHAPAAVLAVINGPWDVSIATASEYPAFRPAPAVTGPGNVAVPGLLPRFSGTIRYRCRFHDHAGSADVPCSTSARRTRPWRRG